MHNESGRSLVEILSVLAIIGIISIAGITGYKLAVYRYTASQIIDTTNKFAFIIFDRCRSVYDNHNTALQSIESCTQYTPGIPKFEDANIGSFPEPIFNKGIYFKRIEKEENSNSYFVHSQLRFKTKEHCLSIKYLENIKTGCAENSAPFTIYLKTKEN